jgi:hypothetical protein
MVGRGGGVADAAKTTLLFVASSFLLTICPSTATAYDAMVQWQAVANASKYRVYLKHNNGSYTLAKEKTGGASTSDVVPAVQLSLTTRFVVTAVSSGGSESAISNEIAVAYAEAARVVDTDGDGLTDSEEDLDLDMVVDSNETNPNDADSDDDGLSDFNERVVTRTDPLKRDTDGDAASDGTEVAAGTDPRAASSSPNVWVLADDDYATFHGAMKRTTAYAGGADQDSAADSIGAKLVFADSTTSVVDPGSGDEVSYAVDLPASGQWYVWGRFYYPSAGGENDANSFFVSVDGGATLKFGNNRDYYQKWHWGGDGNQELGAPVSLPLGYLAAGTHVITVEKREVWPTPPRLDALMLTLDSSTVPNDATARNALASALVKCTGDAACDDGNVCNGRETCNPSVGCVAGTALVCDDGNKCNGAETCAPSTGCKAGTPLVCNDGNQCNGVETCVAATGCKAGTPLVCDDGNQCNGAETCSPSTGCKAGTPMVCDDGNKCNGIEICTTTGCRAGAPLICDDCNRCNGAETCVAATGCKAGTPPVCDDGNVCNGTETCSPSTGCKAGTPLVCDDGNKCNGTEICTTTGCKAGTPLVCNDSNVCNGVETCIAATGCKAGTALVCNDGNACNGVETCDRTNGCKAGTVPVCDDDDICNGVEACDPSVGCKAGTPLACNDNDACNGVETCNAASGCQAGTPPVCDDDDVCNGLETCDATRGCVAGTPLTCDDGRFCNGMETCNPGFGCMAGTPIECGIFSHQCEDSVCNEAGKQCVIAPKTDGTGCDDGLGCTMFDVCVAGACKGVDSCGEGEVCGQNTGVCELTGDRDNDGLFDALDPCPDEARNLCVGDVAVDRTEGLPIRIHAGTSKASCAGQRTDCNGDEWYEDFGYRKNLGSTSCTLTGRCPIAGLDTLFGCEDVRTQDVLQCDHSSLHPNRRMVYDFDLANGTYLVNLYFANTQTDTAEVGDRIFDISFEGRLVYSQFDQVAAAGGSGVAVVRSAIVEVSDDDGLTIALQPRVGEVALKAIEVIAPTP